MPQNQTTYAKVMADKEKAMTIHKIKTKEMAVGEGRGELEQENKCTCLYRHMDHDYSI